MYHMASNHGPLARAGSEADTCPVVPSPISLPGPGLKTTHGQGKPSNSGARGMSHIYTRVSCHQST
jgi:hypothetical protein